MADTLLLIPGLMCDHTVWEPVMPALQTAADCRVVDHGLANSLRGMAEQVLQAAPPRFAIAGHSMGARVALEVLRLAPERVSRVALLDTGYTAKPLGAAGEDEAAKRYKLLALAQIEGVRAMAQAWVRGMVHPDRLQDAALIEDILLMFERKSALHFEKQINALLTRADASDVLRAIRVPTLVLCGAQDSWAPIAQHEAMQALVPNAAQARLSVIDHAGHMAPMERPEAVAEALLSWMSEEVTV